MNFTAKLVTETPMERPIQKFAPDSVNADGVARGMLSDAARKPGDKVEIYETRQVLVGTLVLMGDNKIEFTHPATVLGISTKEKAPIL